MKNNSISRQTVLDLYEYLQKSIEPEARQPYTPERITMIHRALVRDTYTELIKSSSLKESIAIVLWLKHNGCRYESLVMSGELVALTPDFMKEELAALFTE